MQRPISAVAHMCITVPSCSLSRSPPPESAYRPGSSDTPWSRSARVFPASAPPSKPQRIVASVPISRYTYIYIYINNISVKETNSTSSSLLPRSHLKGPPLNRSDPWNYLYSFFFFFFFLNIHAENGPVSTRIWRTTQRRDTTRHGATRGDTTHIHIHTCAQGWNIGARGSGRARWCRFLRGIVRGTGRDAPGSESTTPLNPCKRSLRRTIIKVYTHPRRIHRKGAGCCIQGAADSRRTRFRTSDDGARP